MLPPAGLSWDKLLYAHPEAHVYDVNAPVGGYGHVVRPIELAVIFTKGPPFFEDVPLQIELQYAVSARRGVMKISTVSHIYVAVSSDFQAPRTSKFAALPLLEKVAVAIEDLNAGVRTISDVDLSLIVDCNTVRRIELTRLVTLVTPVEKELSLGGELGHTTVAISVRDVE